MTTIKTGNRRLLKLAAFLEKLPRKRFDYRTVVGSDWKGRQNLSCGTTACAIGWACTMPEFRRYGLRIEDGLAVGAESYCDDRNRYGGSAMFCLTADEWRYLFQPADEFTTHSVSPLPMSSTPKQVAKHIRRFVARRDEGGAQ